MKQTGILAAVSAVIVLVLTVIGSHMMMNALMLAVISFVGFAILWIKSPFAIRKFMAKFDLLLDALVGLGAFAFVGFSTTGIFAAGIAMTFTSVLLSYNKKYVKDESERREVIRCQEEARQRELMLKMNSEENQSSSSTGSGTTKSMFRSSTSKRSNSKFIYLLWPLQMILMTIQILVKSVSLLTQTIAKTIGSLRLI